MKLIDLFALLVGASLGGLFAFLKLPIPAPTTLGGVLGVVGVALGAASVTWLMS